MFNINYIFIIFAVSIIAAGQITFKFAAQSLRILPSQSLLALLRAEADNTQRALQFLQAAKRVIQRSSPSSERKVQIFGPAPAPMTRRAGVHRAQLLLRATQPATLQRILSTSVMEMETLPETRKVRWSVDVDPIELF